MWVVHLIICPRYGAATRVSATAQYPKSPKQSKTAVDDDEMFTYWREWWRLIGWSRIIGLLLFIRCQFESDCVNPNPDYTIVYKLWIRRVGVETLQPRLGHHPDAVSDNLIQPTLHESLMLCYPKQLFPSLRFFCIGFCVEFLIARFRLKAYFFLIFYTISFFRFF